MSLLSLVSPARSVGRIAKDLDVWSRARGSAERLSTHALPSERTVCDGLRRRAEREIAGLEIERHALGALDLVALLRQLRPGPAPRWFIYDPLRECDAVKWSAAPRIVFESLREGTPTGRIETPVGSALPASLCCSAAPILLPFQVRQKVGVLRGQGLRPLVLYEPRTVLLPCGAELPPVAEPTHALVLKRRKRWLLLDAWSDPLRGARALAALGEFYVRPPGAIGNWAASAPSRTRTTQ
jgi:hypothetical protein